MMQRRGFTLVEIMIVVAIIALLAGLAIPNLLRARLSAQEAAVIALIKTIHSAEIEWRATNSMFASWDDLRNATPPYINPSVPYNYPYGYAFTILGIEPNRFFACAEKQQGHSFYIDEAGVLCKSTGVTQQCPYSSNEHMGGQCNGAWQNIQ